jgi:sugar lactone lactonase YvrE
MRTTIIFVLTLISNLSAQSLSGPESLEFDSTGNRYLISNKTAGQILARDAGGTLSVFTDDPVSPAGMEIMNNVVYVADGGSIRGYRLSDAVRVVNFAIPGASFLNGLANNGSNKLWASDFTTKKLHEIDVTDPLNVTQTTLVPATGNTPNGVLWDAVNNRLLVVSWGSNASIFAYRFSDQNYAALINTTFGNMDGIAVDCQGRTYVSSWSPASTIKRFDAPLTASSVASNFVSAGLSNPADITFNSNSGDIAAPNAGSNVISLHATGCGNIILANGFE